MPYPLKRHINNRIDDLTVRTHCGLAIKNVGDLLRLCNSQNAPCDKCEAAAGVTA